MRTNIEPSDPPVKPGLTIPTYRYNINNFRLHKMLEGAAILAMGLLECDSNNMSGEVRAQDSRNIGHAVSQIEREWAWAKKHKDAPQGSHENTYTINFPQPNVIQAMKNTKLKSVALELANFVSVVVGSQAGDAQVWVGEGSEINIDYAVRIVREVVTSLVGDGSQTEGSSADAPTYNTGVTAPDFSHLGELTPPPNEASVQTQEASRDAQPPNVPDAPDVPSR